MNGHVGQRVVAGLSIWHSGILSRAAAVGEISPYTRSNSPLLRGAGSAGLWSGAAAGGELDNSYIDRYSYRQIERSIADCWFLIVDGNLGKLGDGGF
jgi:hypothetical protein